MKEAKKLLLNHKTGCIADCYSGDLNHAWYVLGDICYKLRDFDCAVHSFRKALSEEPNDVHAMWGLGNSYSELSQPKKAAKWFGKALEIEPLNPSITYNYANCLFDLREYKVAIDLYRSIPPGASEFTLARKNMRKARKLLSLR
ncbi:tetratricopeptide repeat protein [Thiorhodococcus minor]|uniref:Tetratricopeptide repeat protein n=1 Tax=Thiorhodococcus minor TaxID=57489 RepID=A0A6M0K9P6_9GAMM|nr:tetratricopeptide repeat protein [Thiorhodococcus minor]NEV65275.1 tetratricopeptide repeat protein [Thiorhodococcus minor]